MSTNKVKRQVQIVIDLNVNPMFLDSIDVRATVRNTKDSIKGLLEYSYSNLSKIKITSKIFPMEKK